ncbi:hypothetical protein [Streptomyces sp. SLBN-115]|uniref:hypothetical protein n=1 Tax=Streptomyces sp. SLBN-115 TaxID=2768453 RepID=UPI00114FA51A|nr:hypothetical protein [Streptomyces sp. SLBN-115]TQJ37810.1 hypothetical protein FBY34_7974 [Streptomyces sp. SLBN-115]
MKPLLWRGMRVPYLTSWTAEHVPQTRIIKVPGPRGQRIGYVDENEMADRRLETLWVRTGLAQGCGRPDFLRNNSHRQKLAMRNDLCQLCGQCVLGWFSKGRTLQLVGGSTPIYEGETTTAPPVHPLCAVEATQNCPPLRRGYAAALVKRSVLWGVAGIVHDPKTLTPLPHPGSRPGELQHVHIGDKEIRWTLASFTVHSVHGVTSVSPAELQAMAEADTHRASANGQPVR